MSLLLLALNPICFFQGVRGRPRLVVLCTDRTLARRDILIGSRFWNRSSVDSCGSCFCGTWHGAHTEVSCVRVDGLNNQLVTAEVVFGIIENLPCYIPLRKCRTSIPWHNRSVVNQIQEATGMLGQDDLLLCPLDGSCKMMVVRLLELLSSLKSQRVERKPRRKRHTILLSCASATRLWASARTSSCSSCTIFVLCGSLYLSLAISSETWRVIRLKISDSRNRVYFSFVVPAWLYRTLRIAYLLENAAIFLQCLGEDVLLISNLSKQHTKLVRDIRNSLVLCGLTPLGKLLSNADSFPPRCLVSPNGMVLRFDDLEQLFGKLRLLRTSEGRHGEAVLGSGLFAAAAALLGTDGE